MGSWGGADLPFLSGVYNTSAVWLQTRLIQLSKTPARCIVSIVSWADIHAGDRLTHNLTTTGSRDG